MNSIHRKHLHFSGWREIFAHLRGENIFQVLMWMSFWTGKILAPAHTWVAEGAQAQQCENVEFLNCYPESEVGKLR